MIRVTDSASVVTTPGRPWGAGGLARMLPGCLEMSRVRGVLTPLALAAIVFAVFIPALWNGFVDWDDQVNLTDNPHYRGLGWTQIRWMLSNVLMGHWIPVTWLTFGLDYELWGMAPRGYHLTSLLLHALGAAAFYFVARRLLALAGGFSGPALEVGAAGAALFFALHPLRVESVVWATERRDVLSGLFFLLTVLVYLRAAGAAGYRRRRLLAGALGLYALALASKGSVMVLPAVLVVLDFYPLRRLDGRWRRWLETPARRVWLEKVPFAILGAAGAAVIYYAQSANRFLTSLDRLPLDGRIAMSFHSLGFYLWKTVLPAPLSPLYELPATVDPLAPRFVVPAVAVTLAAAALVAFRRRWPAGLAVGAAYAIGLAPVIGLVHSGHQLTHDRYSYLPGFALALLAGGAAAALVRAAGTGLVRPGIARLAGVAAGAWLLGLAALTTQQIPVWRDSESLWQWAVDADPRCAICQGNLGTYFMKQGLTDLAMERFQTVAALRPGDLRVHKHLAEGFARRRDPERALAHYERYLARYPTETDVLNNYAVALIDLGRYQDALTPLGRAATVDPGHVFAHANLGRAMLGLGRPEAALTFFRRAIALKWDTPVLWAGLAEVYLARNDRRALRTALGILSMLDRTLAAHIAPVLLETW